MRGRRRGAVRGDFGGLGVVLMLRPDELGTEGGRRERQGGGGGQRGREAGRGVAYGFDLGDDMAD